MKKILLTITMFLLTGCFGEIGKGIITKECKKNEIINGTTVDTNITIKSKEGNINSINITETYDSDDLTSILNSKKSEKNMYRNEPGISININDKIITYEIDVTSINDFVINRFNINKETHKMLKYYEDNGFTCK
ncbi:MAG: hypothetical protein J6D28_03545 [Bacilli bacterium]|nr:hypothetical protein [Bacilli bacterium]